MKKILAAVSAIGFMMCAIVTSFIALSYDGGVRCFMSPTSCWSQAVLVESLVNVTENRSVKPLPTITSTPLPLPPTPTQWPTPEPTVLPIILPSGRMNSEGVNCGQSAYKLNTVSNLWSRKFDHWCFPFTRDPFERIFFGMDYGQVGIMLDNAGIGGLSHEEQIVELSEMGYWDFACGCVP